MIRNTGVDVNGINFRIHEKRFIIVVTPLNAKGVADGVELRLRPLADRVDARLGVALINRDELSSEAEADEGDINFPTRCHSGRRYSRREGAESKAFYE